MGTIKSALELALERTSGIQADKKSLETRELKEKGMRLFALLEKGDDEEVQAGLKAAGSDEKKALLEGLLEVSMSRISLPQNSQNLDALEAVSKALGQIFPGDSGIQGMIPKIREFLENYLESRTELIENLGKRFEPRLREKEEQLARQTGQRVRLRPEQDPDFARILQQNLDQLDGQYSQVIDNIKEDIRTRFREVTP